MYIPFCLGKIPLVSSGKYPIVNNISILLYKIKLLLFRRFFENNCDYLSEISMWYILASQSILKPSFKAFL